MGPLSAPRLGRFWVIFTTVLGAVAMLAFIVLPVSLPRFLGAPTVVFLGIGLLIPWLVLASQFGRIFQIPVVPTLLLIAVAFSLSGAFDNHAVGRRAIPHMGAPVKPVADRLNLDEAYRAWLAQAPRDDQGRPVMVLVAAEGGASRAGFWTGEVLTGLHERTAGKLPRSLFAISSVSGGSVGAVGYAAVLANNAAEPDKGRIPVGRQLEHLTGADALSPVVAGLLFPDLLYRFLPLPFLPDRAEALERSWEDTWAAGSGPAKLNLSQAFLALRPTATGAWRPILMVNGASEQTGRRVLTSTIEAHPRIDAHDFHDLTKRDVPISSAIHNGARFPWVSPAGTLTDAKAPCWAHGHVIDGGYFDTVGIEALRELADAIARGPGRRDNLRIIFVIAAYSGQPQTAADKAADAGAKPAGQDLAAPLELADAPIVPKWWLNEVLTPMRGFFSSRDGHGYHMARELRTMVRQRADQPAADIPVGAASAYYAPAMLCETKAFQNPMNWALSKRSQDHMRCAAGRNPLHGKCHISCPVTVETLKSVADIVNATNEPPPAQTVAPIPPGTPPSASD